MKKYIPIIFLMILFFNLNPTGVINAINEINQTNQINETSEIDQIDGIDQTDQINQNAWVQDTQNQSDVGPVKVSEDYTIGKGDVLNVFVWRNEKLSSHPVVRPDGKISLPLLKDLQAEGLTVLELEQEITQKLNEYINNPEVTVIVNKINSYNVSILGEVVRSGIYPVTGDTRLVEVISMAGGFTESADKREITVITNEREKRRTFTLNYEKIVSGEDPNQNIILKRGDTIIVNKVKVSKVNSFKVSVLGKVANPGIYPITGDTTVLEAISMAGGFTESADKREIAVITHQDERKKKVTVNYEEILSGEDPNQNIILKHGDAIIVDEIKRDDPIIVNEIKSFKVSILGKVANPGIYPITGDTTVLDAISMAGGFTEWAKKTKITVITQREGEKKKVKINYNKIVSGKDLSQNIILKGADTVIVP